MKPIPFYRQECYESCVPACLRMILADNDIERAEADLYKCCETDEEGTLPSATVQCAKQFRFEAKSLRLSTLNELVEYVSKPSTYVIAYVDLSYLLNLVGIHAVIIQEIQQSEKTITVIDPMYPPKGRREWSLPLFNIGWQIARRQVICISAP